NTRRRPGGARDAHHRPRNRRAPSTWRPTIAADKALSWAYTEEFLTEPDALRAARDRSEELGLVPVSVGLGAALRMLAAASTARAVAEVGTGAGGSGLWLLEGMAADGVLTTIDIEVEHQRAAEEADAAPDEAGDYADQAIRMLRPGGILAVAEALWHDRVADPARRDETTVAMREVGRTLREREDISANLLPVGGGLLVAITS